MKETENQEDYKDSIEDSIIDVDEITTTDIKINPDYYIHTVLLKAQKALTKDNVKDGLIQFRFLIEHAEILCKAANRLPQDYEEKIIEYKKTDAYNTDTSQLGELGKSMKLAHFKLELMLTEVFNVKESTEPLRF